jgi:hypothetical protein
MDKRSLLLFKARVLTDEAQFHVKAYFQNLKLHNDDEDDNEKEILIIWDSCVSRGSFVSY